jgi:peptidoglycan/LPS O-acetylase OafA/YrhL
MAQSLGAVLERNRGVGPGFDVARLALATGVVLWHSFGIAQGSQAAVKATPLWALELVAVPMFFALSGFLLAASVERSTPSSYALNRALRIFPALWTVVAASALVIGPLVTILPLPDYFNHREFFLYFTNLFGWLQDVLPGVFARNPNTHVNGALWTIAFELGCYATLGALFVLRLHRNVWILALLSFGLMIAAIVAPAFGLIEMTSGLVRKVIDELLVESGARLIPMFFVGALLYRLRRVIAYSAPAALAIAAAGAGLAAFGDSAWMRAPWLTLIATPLMAYLIIFIGLSPMPKLPFFGGGDYSYGVYVYHVPVQQVIVHVLGAVAPLVLFALSFPIVSMLAALSWRFIEKPAMGLRRNAIVAAWAQDRTPARP